LKFDPADETTIVNGAPNNIAFNYLSINTVTKVAATTYAVGDILMDYWIFADSTYYVGDLIRWLKTGTLPDVTTDFYVTYKPLSVDISCEAEAVGVVYNVTRSKIVYKVSLISNIQNVENLELMTGGEDLESDDALRSRIQYATEVLGKATVESLRQSILAISGITSVSVDDLPLKVQPAESHLHVSFAATPTQNLDFEIVQDNVSLVLTGTRGGGPVTFINGTDYVMTDSTILWQSDLVNPDDGTVFAANGYEYRWLGHVDIYVAGSSFPLPASVLTQVNTVVADTKAAGVTVVVYEPTSVTVNINVDILVDTASGFSFTEVSTHVMSALASLIVGKGIGADIYLAEITETVMNVDGVLNVVINVPAADVVIAASEIARVGTLTVGSL
jgi:phage-related baseplate assembly protein